MKKVYFQSDGNSKMYTDIVENIKAEMKAAYKEFYQDQRKEEDEALMNKEIDDLIENINISPAGMKFRKYRYMWGSIMMADEDYNNLPEFDGF